MTGQPDGPPTLPPFGLADGVTALAGLGATMMALYHRDARGGGGQVIDLSLLEPLLTLLGPLPSAFDQLGVIPQRTGNRSPNNAPRNTYRTRDQRWVVVSASASSVARRVMRLVGREDLISEPWFDSARERVKRADELDRAVAEWIAERDCEAVVRAFEEAGAALAVVYDVQDLMSDPQVASLDAVTTIEDEDLGPLRMQNVIFRLQSTPGRVRFGGRRLGQDTDAVYRELLGLAADDLAQLRGEGVL